MDSLDKNDSPNLTSLMEKLSQSELTSILELLQNKTSEEVTGTLSKFGNTLNCLIGNIHVMSEYDLIHWCCSIKLLTNTLQSSEKQVLARLKYIKDSYRCAKCKRNAAINYDMGLLANLQSHSCNPPPSTGAQCLEARLIKKLKEYELYRTIRYDKSVEELFYKVTVDNAETICFYSVTSTREGVFTCLVCGRDVSGRQNIIQHVFGNKHIGTIHEDYAIILAFHTCFSRLERKYQMLQMNFRYRDEKKVECLMCSKMVHFQNMKSHMDGPCFKLGNDAQNYKFIIKYHQLVEDTIYKDLLEYYVVVSNYRCPILQHIDGRIYCILCNATVNKHICIHIDSKAHQQSLSSTHMLQLLKRYHQIWAAQPIHVQIEQIYFRKREHKITCTVCSNYLSYDSAMLTQHVDSVDHKRFLMKATEIRTSSSNLLKQGPESVSSRSTSVETDRNASLSTSSSSSDIGNRIVANSTMADVPSPPTPNSPVSRNLSETATLIPYDETVLDDLYSDGLVHFIVTIGSTKYPTIIKREACKYCLLCNVDITTTVLLHANSPQHVEAMTVDRRCELLKKFHELWIRLPQTDQCRQVLFTIEEDLVCSLCNQKMSYDVDEVKSHLESWEHVQKLMVTRTNATVQEPTFSQAANNGTVPDSPRKIDDKICEETPKTPTEKVKLLQDLLSGFKFTSPSENKTNTTVTKNAERKFDNSSTKPAVPVNYSQETLDELYSEELIHYHVRIGNIRYPFIQNMGTYKRCLICNIDLINSILFHVNSPPHVAMLNNPKKMEQLKSYHDLWLNFSEPYQREQKYFEVGEKLSCSPCQKVLEYDVGALTAHIFSTGHGNKTWELNNQSSTGSGKVVNAQHKVKEKAPRSCDDLIDFNDPQPVTEKKPAVNESTASDLVTGLPPVHEKQLNAVEEFDSLALYSQSIVDTIYFDLMQYTVVVNARVYPYIQRRLAKCYCLICRMEMDPLFVSSHCMGTKHTRRYRDQNCLEILTKFHDVFMRLSPEQQIEQIHFKPTSNAMTCLPCCHILLSTIECVQQHLGTDRHREQVANCGLSLKSNEKNVKVKNAIKKKGVLRSYPEAIMEVVYANLEQYTFNAKGSSYLYMQNRIGTKYCLLCQKPVHTIAEHIKTDEHSNNETNISIREFVQRFHILFLNVADHLQFNQIHFKPQPDSIECLRCLSSCSTTAELTEHLQSDKHYQLITVESTDDSMKSLAVEEFDSLVLYTQSIVDTIYFDLMQYTVVVNARIYPYIQRRLAKCYCLICRMEMDPLFVSSHCMGTKHTHRCRDGNCLEILTKFHDIFMRLSPEQQTQQIYFKPGNTITCLPCSHVLLSTIECVQQHLGTDRHHEQVAKCGVSLKSNEKNVKVKNAIKKKAGVLRRYPEAIMEMVYPNLEQYTFNAKGSSYLYMQNRIGTKYCLLCQKPVHAIAEHIKSDEHSNNETNIGICEFVQRYHILFLNVADQLQFNQIHFKPQAGSIKCLKCLSSCSTTVELMQHLQSDKHYQLIAMEGTDDSIKSLEEIDESPLNFYSENTMNTIYRDLAQYIIGINNFLYPYIQHRSDGFYCLICSKAVSQLSEIEAHNSSDKHVDNYQDLYRLQAVSHYHEVFMRLSPEHQKQQIYFELCDYQMVCLPCAVLCPYLREFVREHLKSVEHNEQLAIYKSKKGKVKLPESSATANNKELSLRTYCKNAMCTMYANLEQYTVVIKEVKYLYMQNRDMLKYCLLCVKYLENINDHVMSDEHRANEGDAKALKLVKMFHDFFLPLHKNLQLHQICFEPQADGVRCLKCECFCPSSLELKSHLQSESHNNVVGNLLLSDVVRLKNANVKDGKVCALRKAYPKTVKKTVYKRLQQYTVAIGNVEYFYIQIRGATKYCLICRSKVKDVPAHILSCEHLNNQADIRLLDAVKEYHNIFLSLKNELPIQQICFVPETGGVRCMKCGLSYSTPSHVALHIQTDEHNVLYIDQSEDKCNVSNGNCSKIIELNNFDLVIKRARKEYCILCECIDEQNHIRTDKHIAKCFGNNGAPLSLSRKALAFLKRWNELGTMYESMRNDFLPASAALTFCLKCGLNVEYNMLENHLLQFHTGVFHHFSEKLSPNAHQPKTPYSQNILDTCFKSNISQCNIVVDTISYPIILNMPDGLFCLLCRKMVNEHVHSHLTSDFHRNLIFESQPAKRKFFQYHDIWTSVSNEYQQQMVHFNNGSSFLCYCTLCATGIRNKELKLHLDSLEHVSALDFNKLKANMQLRKQQKSQRQEGDTLASNTADSSELSGSVLSTRSECDPPNKKQVIVSLDRLQISSLFEENPFVDNHAVLEEEMENESAVEGCDVIEDDFLPGHAYPREANDFIRKLHRLDVDVMQSTPNGKLFCLLCQSEVRKLVTHASLPQHEIKASHRSADVECIRVFHREWKKVDVLKRWLEATFFPVALTLAFCKKCGFNVEYSCLNNHLTKCHDNLLDIEFHLKLDEDFHFISKKEYCAKVRKTIYKDNIPQCDVILEGVSYPVIQTLDDNLRCLLCRKEIPDRAYDHLNSTEHISNAVNVVTRRRLKSYHDTWLDGDEDFQMQQIYFEKDRDYYCKICVVDLKATELREHIMNGFHGTSLKKFLINEHILHKLNMFHDVEITPQPDTSKAIVQSSRHSLMCEPRANDSGTEDSDDDDRNYPDSFVEEYYPQFDKYYVTINNIRYPIFRNTVAGCVCMICKRSPRTHIIEVHAEKDSHKSRMTNPTRQNKLRTFHKVWMKQNSSVQEHQKYFNQSKCLACNLQIDYDDIAVHVESEKHLQKISLPLNLSDVSGSMESLNPSSSISNSSTPVRSRSVQNENGVVQVPVPLGIAAAAIKPLIPPSAANNKKMYHSIRRSVPNSNGLSIIEMIPYRYSKQTRFLIIDKVKNIFCECCSKKLKNDIISIKEHLDSDNHLSLSKVPRNKMKYFCEICNKHYSMESSWDNHLIDLTHTARFNNLGKTRKERITEYECSNCNLVIFGDEISLQRHNTGYQKKKVKELVLPKPVLQLLTSKSYIEGNSKDLLIEANNASQNQDKERQVCVALVKVLKEKFPMCKAYPFGSRVTGLGYCDSDLDVFLDIGDMYQGSHHQGADEQAGIVNVVAKTLEKHRKSFSDINKVAGARTPIVQVFHKESNIDCDISFRHGLSVENTAFIRLCLDLQTILRPTMLYLKEWYAVTNITGISSYALTMLMIFYLQTTGYLLSVKELRVINAEKGTVIDGWETIKYTLSLQRMKEYINRCDYTVAQLMENFFEYYAKFDFEKWVVCPLMGFLVEKSHFNGNGAALPVEMEKYVEKLKNRDPEYFRNLTPICVQDPFDLSHNVTKACSRDMQKKFQAYCSLSKNHLSALK